MTTRRTFLADVGLGHDATQSTANAGDRRSMKIVLCYGEASRRKRGAEEAGNGEFR